MLFQNSSLRLSFFLLNFLGPRWHTVRKAHYWLYRIIWLMMYMVLASCWLGGTHRLTSFPSFVIYVPSAFPFVQPSLVLSAVVSTASAINTSTSTALHSCCQPQCIKYDLRFKLSSCKPVVHDRVMLGAVDEVSHQLLFVIPATACA